MQVNGVSTARRLLPRWRSLARTPASELLRSRQNPKKGSPLIATLSKRWEEHKGLVQASDIIDAALITGDYVAAVPSALKIINEPFAVPGLVQAAQQVLGHVSDRPISVLSGSDEWKPAAIFPAIARLKRRLELYPRDAFTAIEIARLQSQIGQVRSAKRFIDRAVLVAPNDRYVLRCCARFFSLDHVEKDDERSLDAIWSSDIVRTDPWVQAAEITVARLCGRTPKWAIKSRKALVTGGPRPIQFSELAAGLATLEHETGASRKRVADFLKVSLSSPTENALAQAIVSQDKLGLHLDIAPHLISIANAFEARARDAYKREEYRLSVDEAWRWMEDQHLSPVAAIFGAFVSTCMLADYRRAEQFARVGLTANSNHPALLNALVVALAFQGKVLDARNELRRFETHEPDMVSRPFVLAARGLVEFRAGNIPGGRTAYLAAIEICKQAQNHLLAANAAIYWIEQELLANSIPIDLANQMIAQLDSYYEPNGKPTEKSAVWRVRRKIVLTLLRQSEMRNDILLTSTSMAASRSRAIQTDISLPVILT